MKVRLNSSGEVCILRSSGELTISEDAVSTCTAEWFCFPFESAGNYAPSVGKSNHPIWSDLYCKSVAIKKPGSGAIIVATYEGADGAWSSSSDSGENTVEVSCTMREEPIETHPDFEDWAGTPKKPNAGIFDDDGKFTGWNSDTDLGKEFAGVKSYLVPSYSGSISCVSQNRPNLSGIGSRGGGGGLPSIGGGREWLCTGISYSTIADGKFRVTETYLSSGEKGWNKKIY